MYPHKNHKAPRLPQDPHPPSRQQHLLPLTEQQGGLGLAVVVGRWGAAGDHGGAGIAAQRLLEDPGQLAVSVGHVNLWGGIQRGEWRGQGEERSN